MHLPVFEMRSREVSAEGLASDALSSSRESIYKTQGLDESVSDILLQLFCLKASLVFRYKKEENRPVWAGHTTYPTKPTLYLIEP